MAAETARAFAALERQAQVLMSAFIAAGHEAVSPAVIQPARYFLDVIGESLRARTYVFTDPDGDELCLRPDLTVPACRLHLERDAEARQPAKYCYNGAAFRFQPMGGDSTHPREFRQAGIENFGDAGREAADAETVALILSSLRAAGLRGEQLRLGDLGLFRALLKSVAMPERWRQLLMHRFWRPEAFRAELKRLVSGTGQMLDPKRRDFVATLDETDRDTAQAQVASLPRRPGHRADGLAFAGRDHREPVVGLSRRQGGTAVARNCRSDRKLCRHPRARPQRRARPWAPSLIELGRRWCAPSAPTRSG